MHQGVKESERLTSAPRSSKSNESVLFATNGFLEDLVGKHINWAWHLKLALGLDASLLSDEVGQAVQIASTIVVDRLIALSIKKLECGESLNTESLSKGLLGIGVDLGNLNVLGGCKDTGELLVDGSKVLAVATPGSREGDNDVFCRVLCNMKMTMGTQIIVYLNLREQLHQTYACPVP